MHPSALSFYCTKKSPSSTSVPLLNGWWLASVYSITAGHLTGGIYCFSKKGIPNVRVLILLMIESEDEGPKVCKFKPVLSHSNI